MSYEKHTWTSHELITTSLMNNIEDGIQDAIAIANGKADPVVTENVSGTDPVIVGVANHMYICGECQSLSVTAPASGAIEVWFESGSTATILNPTGVIMPDWWAGTETDRVYDLIVTNGYGVVTSWAG